MIIYTGLLNLGWNWLKNTVPAELLWEKNNILAEKTSRTVEYGETEEAHSLQQNIYIKNLL